MAGPTPDIVYDRETVWDVCGLIVFALAFWLCVGKTWRCSALVLPKPSPETNWFFFTATAQDDRGLESDYSNEVMLVTTNKPPLTVKLAWDPSPSTNWITNYALYQGPDSRTYTQKVNVGTALTGSVPILPQIWTLVVSFSGDGVPGLTLTNPGGNLFVRGRTWQARNQLWPTVLQGSISPSGPWSDLSGILTNYTRPSMIMKVQRWRQ